MSSSRISIALFLCALGVGALAPVAHAQSSGVIYACVRIDGSGDSAKVTRVTGPSGPCKQNEVLVRWNVAGAPGPKGDTGATGAAGPQGPQGATGLMGAAGPQGSQGDAGAAGLQGAAGPKGATGPIGEAGPKGATGDTGATGSQGPQGATGPTGPQGETGPSGIAGNTGAAGPQGDSGPTGAAGATGAPGAQGIYTAQPGIRGELADCGGPAPAGTLVYIPGRAFTTVTGSDGTFLINNVPAGTYPFRVQTANLTADTSVTVASDIVDVGVINVCSGE